MRTKTLLLSAVIGAAGVASAMAQTVYSVNIVGYINMRLDPGLSLIANQLDASPNNTLPNVFGTPAGILSISKFNPATGNFATSVHDPDLPGWTDPTMTLEPGEGAFADNPPENAGPLNITLVGQVRLNSTVNFTPGLKIVSSVIPQAGAVSPDLGFPTPPGQFTISKFNRTTGAFAAFPYDPDAVVPGQPLTGWVSGVPSLAIGEAVFTDTPPETPAFAWTRSFQVGP